MDEFFEGEKAWYDRDPIFEVLERESSDRYDVSPCFTGSGRLHHIDIVDRQTGRQFIHDDPEKLLRLVKGKGETEDEGVPEKPLPPS